METGSQDCNGDYDIILAVQAPEQYNYSTLEMEFRFRKRQGGKIWFLGQNFR
jgi:hypothetical protein